MRGVEVSGLSKSYGPRRVLEHVDLEVPDGSLTAVLGPSGSGKTTLLRLLAGFERPDSGRVELGGEVVEAPGTFVAPERRQVGYVPQDAALFPHLSVSANVGFGLARSARGRGREDELLSLVGLEGEGRRFPHQLSGGQQQRVALARALARRPRLVLLDEPFSSLDAGLRAGLRADVQRVLREQGATAVLVTHDQDEALSLADQVAVLRAGRIVQAGSPEELYTRPADPEIAAFVGDANLLPGVLLGGRVETALGALALASGLRPLGEGSRVVVLLRPEHLEVVEAGSVPGATAPGLDPSSGAGLAGRVVESYYYGHDAMLTIEAASEGAGPSPSPAAGRLVLRARLPGRALVPAGTDVVVRGVGPAVAWPSGTIG